MKFLAYYLPQYHPIPENDKWWGTGFTEWTNVTKAKPLFKGHKQPIIPGELGYYDLVEQPEVQEKQAQLAREYGVDGFIYYQYWFGNGKMLLEKPAEQMLKNKNVDIAFCFCWANETWKGIWHGLDNPNILIEQTYPGEDDYINYFNYLLPFFNDERYIKVENKPMFHIYRLKQIPDFEFFQELFNKCAIKNGFDGIYFVETGMDNEPTTNSVSAIVGLDIFHNMRYNNETLFSKNSILGRIEYRLKFLFGYTDQVGARKKPLIADYGKGTDQMVVKFPHKKYISCVFPNWDNSPRSGTKSLVFKNSSPDKWKIHLIKAVKELKKNPQNPPFLIIKSWNEWAEGNYLEPDSVYGRKWLELIMEVRKKYNI